MINRLVLATAVLATAVIATSLLTACGSSAAHTPGATAPTTPAATTGGQTTTGTTTAPAPAGVTPDDVCALVTLDDVAHATRFTISSTKPSTSGDVSVCAFIGTASDGYKSEKVYLEYQPTGKTAVEYTKAHATAVTGLGAPAFYFDTAAQLSVELDGTASFTIYLADVRAHGGDPKAAATELARIAVPKLQHG